MTKIEDILLLMQRNPKNVRYSDLAKVCAYYFGKARKTSSSHRVYRTPWKGDPRINIQNHKSKAKAYQVRQVLMAIEKLEEMNDSEK